MRARRGAQIALAILFLAALSIDAVAVAAPHSFYADYPFFAHWVALLPPHNEHLVTDVGGLYLGFAVLFAWAAATVQPTLVRAACATWLLTEGLHLAFHATHLEGFGTADAIGEIVSLGLLLVPPLVALWAVGEPVAGVD